ncbi:MAG: threonine synthase [Archangiaceae bacterium]|nr:threonine synthase [Archangiaceae bacterium]
MNCVSTRAPGGPFVSLSEAISRGLAPDGGLYVPEKVPRSNDVLAPYFEGEPLDPAEVARAAFTFPAPLRWLGPHTALLELFHGPTAAFKDFGARFLAECLERLGRKATIVVATSGDTGAAVGAAFAGRQGFEVVILYPDGRVSGRQAHQLGAFGGNVRAFKVAGTFDDCQRMAKETLARRPDCTSANSISLGRLLPQLTYYAKTALEVQRQGKGPVSFVVPTGNLGNALACVLVRDMGLPIDRIVLATNANRTLPQFLSSGAYRALPTVATLANAMDVGDPSNLERLLYWHPDPSRVVSADSVDDAAIRETIRRTFDEQGVVVCPHTACGLEVLRRQAAKGTWVVAATAHPAKFETVVEPLIGRTVAPPAALIELLAKPSHAEPLEASTEALLKRLPQH